MIEYAPDKTQPIFHDGKVLEQWRHISVCVGVDPFNKLLKVVLFTCGT